MRSLTLSSYNLTFWIDGKIEGDLMEGPSYIRAVVRGMGVVICALLKASVDMYSYIEQFEYELDQLLSDLD